MKRETNRNPFRRRGKWMALPGLPLLLFLMAAAPPPTEDFQSIPLQPFIRPEANNESFTLKDLKGRVTLLNFWAPWCIPCRQEMPELQALHQRMNGKVAVIGVTSETETERIKSFLGKLSVTFPVYIDQEARLHRAMDLMVMPTTILFDADGRLVRVYRGFNRKKGLSEMEQDLRKLKVEPQ